MVVDIHVNDDSVEVANLWHVVSFYCSNGCKDKKNFAKLFAFAVKSNKTSRKRAGIRADIFGLGSRPCVSYIIIFSGGYALISSNAPVSESMINPRTTMSFGTSG